MSSAPTPEPDGMQRPKKKHSVLRRILKVCGITIGSLLGLFMLILGAIALILTPQRLTPLVNKYCNRYLDAQVNFDSVHLSLFRNFPNVTVCLQGGEIISHAFRELPDSLRAQIPHRADTLVRFRDLDVTLNLPNLLLRQVSIRGVELVDAMAYACVAPGGKANWDIYQPTDTTTNEPSEPMHFSIHGIRLDRCRVTYANFPDSLYADVAFDRLHMRGGFMHKYRVDMASRMTLRADTLRLCDTLPIGLQGDFVMNFEQPEDLKLNELTINVDSIPMRFDGSVHFAGDSIASNVKCRIHPLSLMRLAKIVPTQLLPELQAFNTNLVLDLETRIDGSYHFADGKLPRVLLNASSNGGYLAYDGTKAKINRLMFDLRALYDPDRADSVGVHVRRFDIQGEGVHLAGKGSAWNLMRDPQVEMQVAGAVSLDTLSRAFQMGDGTTVRGLLGIDLDAAFRMSNLQLNRLGKVRAKGQLTMDNVRIHIPQDTLYLLVNKGHIRFGSGLSRRDSTIARNTEMLGAELSADSINTRIKDQWSVLASRVRMVARSAASTLSDDTLHVHPIDGNVSARALVVSGPDSTWCSLYNVRSTFGVRSSGKSATIPQLNLNFDAGAINLRYINDRYTLKDGQVRLSATLNKLAMDTTRRRAVLDSLQRVFPTVPRDSLFAHYAKVLKQRHLQQDFASSDLDFAVDKSLAKLLFRWDVGGSVKAAYGQVLTPYFPLNNTLENVDIAFTTDSVRVRNTTIRSGSSDVEITGKVANIRQVLLGRGVLKADFNIESDTLNFNELIHAATLGAAYDTASVEYHKQVAEATSDKQLEKVIAKQTSEADTVPVSPLLVIPANLDLDVTLCNHYGEYGTLNFNKLKGEFIVRDRCMQIKDLTAQTNAGEIDLTALYATRSRTDIITGIDLVMKRMQIAQLISLIPSVDTLVPMLRSFQGVVDCKLAATTAIDTMMNVDLGTLSAACSIQGEDMVLLDGETFTEVARMLHFKNKKRNLINRISVNMLVHDKKIEMFPFVVEMDRYKAAVSGVHSLDMSFDYHISVLKSPIPFRLGINIKGTLDKFKFRLCRARYRNDKIPSYVSLIDTTRLNLRRKITDIFQRGIEAANLEAIKAMQAIDSVRVDTMDDEADLSREDSLSLEKEGILPAGSVKPIEVDSTADSTVTDSVRLRPIPKLKEQSDLVATPGVEPPLTPRQQRRKERRQQQAVPASEVKVSTDSTKKR